jgi:hypothetical protein
MHAIKVQDTGASSLRLITVEGAPATSAVDVRSMGRVVILPFGQKALYEALAR